jgi:hypothetical protein
MAVHTLSIPAETGLDDTPPTENQLTDALMEIWQQYARNTAANRLGSLARNNPIFPFPADYARGWRTSAHHIELGLDVPLVVAKRKLIGVRSGSDPIAFVVDAEQAAPELDALSAKDRAAVDDAHGTGVCACKLCLYYRPPVAKW